MNGDGPLVGEYHAQDCDRDQPRFDELQDRFSDPNNPFEYIPVKLKALVGRNRREDQESATGFYPHSGLLSTFQYLSRYPNGPHATLATAVLE